MHLVRVGQNLLDDGGAQEPFQGLALDDAPRQLFMRTSIVKADSRLSGHDGKNVELFLGKGPRFGQAIHVEKPEDSVLVDEWRAHRGPDAGNPQALAG